MKHFLSPTLADEPVIMAYYEKLSGYSSQELVDAYNKQSRLGMVGVYRQALYLIAMSVVFRERFGESPIEDQEGWICPRGEIMLTDQGTRLQPRTD